MGGERGKAARVDLFLGEYALGVETLDPGGLGVRPVGRHLLLLGEGALLIELSPQQRVIQAGQRLARFHPHALIHQNLGHPVAVELGKYGGVFAGNQRPGRGKAALDRARLDIDHAHRPGLLARAVRGLFFAARNPGGDQNHRGETKGARRRERLMHGHEAFLAGGVAKAQPPPSAL